MGRRVRAAQGAGLMEASMNNHPWRRCVRVLAVLAALAAPAVAGADGKLLATGGVMQVEGAAGGGIVPWAVIAGYGTAVEMGGAGFGSFVRTDDYSLTTAGGAIGFWNRVELSFARQDLDVRPLRLNLRQNILGAKLRVAGDPVYGDWPQLSIGMQYKQNLDTAVPRAVGARHDNGLDLYASATRVFLDGPFHRNYLLNATLRATRANQLGLLGFGGDRGNHHELVLEASAAVFLDRRTAIGVEYRQKPDNLGFATEDDWMDVFIAHFPNKQVALVGGYVDLGDIAGAKDQRGLYLSLQLSF